MKLNELEYLRKNRGWTISDLAKRIGISSSYFWQIEKGKRKLSYENAMKIASCFSRKPDDIFYQDFLRGE